LALKVEELRDANEKVEDLQNSLETLQHLGNFSHTLSHMVTPVASSCAIFIGAECWQIRFTKF
jgi:hypothetical protein